MGRPGPSRSECIEALQVMVENYGRSRVLTMLDEAQDALREEQHADCDEHPFEDCVLEADEYGDHEGWGIVWRML